ncbi:asparagine synthase (glutamine-hydrolyzing) [Hymenobacter agri]
MRGVLEAMGNSIAHRGPDDEQYYQTEQIGLVFRRLAIVDLKNGGQPLTNEDNSLVLVANGEIYNHKELRRKLKDKHTFKTASDCEVILHLYEEYGIECLQYLNGMFALALWDQKKQQLYLVRDRLGIKPLYYNVNAERIIFGSEIKSLLPYPDCPREFDWSTALSHSLNQVNQGQKLTSFYKGIVNVDGGEYVQYSTVTNQLTTRAYWSLHHSAEQSREDFRSIADIVRGYKDLLIESTQLQLMSDAGVGVFLSGGIDSVVVAYIAGQLGRIPAYTVFSQSTYQNGDVLAASQAAQQFGLENHQVNFRWQEHPYNAEYWKKLLWYTETPACAAEQLYKYELHRYAKQHSPLVKSILSGQGSDEFNGGYCDSFVNPMHSCYKPQGNNWDSFMLTLRNLEHNNLLQGTNNRYLRHSHLLRTDFLANEQLTKPYHNPWEYYTNMYQYSLKMYNLWHEDRTAAANGIENRVPFLDHRLVEYTLGIPASHYKSLFWNKQILRDAFAQEIGGLSQRPKVPFFLGRDARYTYRMMYGLLIKNNRELIYESVGEPDVQHSILNRAALEASVDDLAADIECKALPELLAIINMGLLAKMTANQLPVPSTGSPIVAERIHIAAQQDETQDISLLLSSHTETVHLERVPRFADEVTVLTDLTGNVHLALNGSLEYILEKKDYADWIRVILQIDGIRPLSQILITLGLAAAAIRSNLEEALDYGIIKFNS